MLKVVMFPPKKWQTGGSGFLFCWYWKSCRKETADFVSVYI